MYRAALACLAALPAGSPARRHALTHTREVLQGLLVRAVQSPPAALQAAFAGQGTEGGDVVEFTRRARVHFPSPGELAQALDCCPPALAPGFPAAVAGELAAGRRTLVVLSNTTPGPALKVSNDEVVLRSLTRLLENMADDAGGVLLRCCRSPLGLPPPTEK